MEIGRLQGQEGHCFTESTVSLRVLIYDNVSRIQTYLNVDDGVMVHPDREHPIAEDDSNLV